jgi:hypothetical protein
MVNPLSPCGPRRYALGSTVTPRTDAWPQAALAAMHVAARKRHVFGVHPQHAHIAAGQRTRKQRAAPVRRRTPRGRQGKS